MSGPSLLTLDVDSLLAILASVSVQDCLAVGTTCKTLSALIRDDSLWRTLAERKWGHRATELPTVPLSGWRAWVQHRTNLVSLSPSPLHLIQEAYPDPWQHIACCVLCSRTSGGPAVRQAIAALLQRLPSPSAVLDAEEADVRELLHPLGLQDTRFAALRALSRDFLEKDWVEPSEFWGCGKFVADSWRVFCRGCRDVKGVDDPTLQRYVRWLAKGVLEEEKKARRAAPQKRKRTSQAPTGEDVGGHFLRTRARRQPSRPTPEAPDRRVTRGAAKSR